MSQCRNYDFYGAFSREWELAFDTTDIMLHPNGHDNIALTSSWKELDDFIDALELALSMRPVVPFDIFLIYDDEAIYQTVLQKLQI